MFFYIKLNRRAVFMGGVIFLIQALCACASPPAKQRADIYIRQFDGTEFIPLDTISAIRQDPTETTLSGNGLYLFIQGRDSVIYYVTASNQFQVPAQIQAALAENPVQLLIDSFRKSAQAAKRENDISIAQIDSLTDLYDKGLIAFQVYQRNRDSITTAVDLRNSTLKSALALQVTDVKIRATIISACMLSMEVAGEKVFRIESDLPLFRQIAVAYSKLPAPTLAQQAFISYVTIYDEFAQEKAIKAVRLAPGKVFDPLNLPDGMGKYHLLTAVCKAQPYTLLLFVKNTCSRCNDERQYLRNLLPRPSLAIYEVSVGEQAGFKNWSKQIQQEFACPWTQVLDTATNSGKAMVKYDLSETPSAFLLDAQMRILRRDPSHQFLDSLTTIQ